MMTFSASPFLKDSEATSAVRSSFSLVGMFLNSILLPFTVPRDTLLRDIYSGNTTSRLVK